METAYRLAAFAAAGEENVGPIEEMEAYSEDFRGRLLRLEAEILDAVEEAGAEELDDMEFRGGKASRVEQPPSDPYSSAESEDYGSLFFDDAEAAPAPSEPTVTGSSPDRTVAAPAPVSAPTPSTSSTSTATTQPAGDAGKTPPDTFFSHVGSLVMFKNPTTFNSVVVKPVGEAWRANMKEGSIVRFENGILANMGPVSYMLPLYEHSLETEEGSPVQGLPYFQKIPVELPPMADPVIAHRCIFGGKNCGTTTEEAEVKKATEIPAKVGTRSVEEEVPEKAPLQRISDGHDAAVSFVKSAFIDPLWQFIDRAIRNPQLDAPSQALAEEDPLDGEDLLLYAARAEDPNLEVQDV
eukprot:tig00020610_g11967.t1